MPKLILKETLVSASLNLEEDIEIVAHKRKMFSQCYYKIRFGSGNPWITVTAGQSRLLGRFFEKVEKTHFPKNIYDSRND
jgi:hypothetical protein